MAGPFPGAEPAAGERRRGARVPVALSGFLTDDGEEIAVSVLDLSGEGALVEAPVVLSAGERFVLSAEGWPDTPVVVRWSKDGRAGLAFAR